LLLNAPQARNVDRTILSRTDVSLASFAQTNNALHREWLDERPGRPRLRELCAGEYPCGQGVLVASLHRGRPCRKY
jgi:hypothetical protein